VPDYADACLKDLTPTDRPLIQILGERLKAMTDVHIPESAWPESEMPEHLRMRVRVVNSEGKTLQESRDLPDLKQKYAVQKGTTEQHRQLSAPDLEQSGLREWDFPPLPERLSIDQGGIKLVGYPSLVDEGDSVAIRLIDAEGNAQRLHKAGVRRLIMLKIAKDIRYLRKQLPQLERMRLLYAKVPAPEGVAADGLPNLEDELVNFILDTTFLNGQQEIRDAESFSQRIDSRRGEMIEIANSVCEQMARILDAYHQVRQGMAKITQKNWLDSLLDMEQQLDRLVFRGFLSQIPESRLADYPRFLAAILKRMEKLPHAAARDRQRMSEMADLLRRWRDWDSQCQQAGRIDERIEEIRWQLEELRISLFAQELGTAFPVSLKRIEKRWQALGL
jgi:ATP-dependent helicase HrpA